MSAYLLPQPQQFFDNNGDPLAGGKVYTCIAGASGYTKTYQKDSYTDSTGLIANSNPVILDSFGRCNIWGDGFNYKLFIFNSSDSLIDSIDNIPCLFGAFTDITVTPSDGTVTTSKIVDGAVTTPKIVDESVTTSKIVDGAVTLDKIASGTIDSVIAPRIGSTGPAGCRNKLHNPLFTVAQRGGAGTVANGQSNWLFDRWLTQVVNLSGCSLTVSASSMVIGGKPRKSMKVTNVASIASLPADSFVYPFTQGIEGRELVDMLEDSATIRCYIRASVAGNYNVALSVRNAAGTTIKCFNKRVSITANTITPVDFTLSTDAANWVCEDSANVGAYLNFCALGGANYQTSTVDAWVSGNTPCPTGLTNWLATAGATVELCMPQLVRGTVAGEFDCLDPIQEEIRCLRYLEMSYDHGTLPGTATPGGTLVTNAPSLSGSSAIINIPFKVAKRATPTVTIYSLSGASGMIRNESTAADLAGILNRASTRSAVIASNAPTTSGHQYSTHFVATCEI